MAQPGLFIFNISRVIYDGSDLAHSAILLPDTES
jgi:hypothetical protein